jgi:hypothetical protein
MPTKRMGPCPAHRCWDLNRTTLRRSDTSYCFPRIAPRRNGNVADCRTAADIGCCGTRQYWATPKERSVNELKNPNPADSANRDPITKAPGAHPVGVGVGAAVGGAAAGVATAAATGAAAGTAAGPVGTVVGAVVGAVVGGLAGKAVAEHYDPTVEDGYWRENHSQQPYFNRDYGYDDYAPAYRLGGEGRGRYGSKPFSAVETDLANDWDRLKGKSRLSWEQAKSATRDGWDRIKE